MGQFQHLFSELQVGSILVKNRVVMGPMLVGYANEKGEVTSTVLDYYEARARGGAGMIIVEASCVDAPAGKEGVGQIHIDGEHCVDGLSKLAAVIKQHNCRALIQIFHAGRQTSSRVTGMQPVAPTGKACTMMRETPHQLTRDEITALGEKFIRAAEYAWQAGFDGVELHAAHGYLLNEFLSPHTNNRDDEYGGKLENRMRVLLNVVDGIKQRVPGLVLGVRLNIDDFVPGGLHPEESALIARRLEQAGVDMIHATCGTYESGLTSIEPASYPEGWRTYLAEEVKRHVTIPVITGGMINHPAYADQLLAEGRADLVFLGRSLLADPEWPNKAQKGNVDDIRPCIRCNGCINTHFAGMPVSCTVNPATGRERQYQESAAPIKRPAQVHVVGAGPAGIQTAVTLDALGFQVVLFEKGAQAGGLLELASIPPHKERIQELQRYLAGRLNRSKVEQVYNYTYEVTDIQIMQPEYLVVATGSKPVQPDLPGSHYCLEMEAVFTGEVALSNQDIVIIGGGSNGCELADFLLQTGNRITILDSRSSLASDMEKKNRRDLLNRLDAGAVKRLTSCSAVEITPEGVWVADSQGVQIHLPCDSAILAIGYKPFNALYHQAQALVPNVYVAGDAFRVRGIKSAILEGEMVAQMISREA